jgi:hypothetical protein
MALVRRYLWSHIEWVISPVAAAVHTSPFLDSALLPAPVLHGLIDTLCYSTQPDLDKVEQSGVAEELDQPERD